MGRSQEKGIINIETVNIRDFTLSKHKKVDDYPYGGGAGMVMSAQPVVDTIKAVKEYNKGKVIFLGPRGIPFNQQIAKDLSEEESLIFVCGQYEGIDERGYKFVDMERSLGDFVLTGGEMACIPVVDSICRLIPGVLGKEESFQEESFYHGLLEYPQYTRPEEFDGEKVPEILLSGHHENIRKWRRKQSLLITKERRKDLFDKIKLSKEDIKLLKEK
jgi:tRNA (guanine37-N1)-methyltransferase